jgi:hypothetical protein
LKNLSWYLLVVGLSTDIFYGNLFFTFDNYENSQF